MSFGGGEWSGESAYDNYFTTPAGHTGVSFVASSGDSGSTGAPEWPSVSPNVLAVGGTQLTTDSAGNYGSEFGWSGSGGGVSLFEAQPAFQRGIVRQSSNSRTVPDVAFDGSSGSPFAVYDTASYSGWLEVYGTSCGAPQWSALVVIANQGRVLAGKAPLDGATQLSPMLYAAATSAFHDVTSGSNGGYTAGPGYDLVTGRGTPNANLVVAELVGPVQPPRKPTLTSLASNINPSVYGQTIYLFAHVFAPGGGTATGLVSFQEGGLVLGQGTLNYGMAIFSTNSLLPGDGEITAVYQGDSTYGSSTSFALDEYVLPDFTTVALRSLENPVASGQSVVLSVQVSPVAPGRGTPTGIAYFFDGATLLGSAPIGGDTASLTVSSFGPGNHRILAIYSGDGEFFGAASSPLIETVTAGVSGTSVASASTASHPGIGKSDVLPSGAERLAALATTAGSDFADPSSLIWLDELAVASVQWAKARQLASASASRDAAEAHVGDVAKRPSLSSQAVASLEKNALYLDSLSADIVGQDLAVERVQDRALDIGFDNWPASGAVLHGIYPRNRVSDLHFS
jgi:hypothetical protein